MKRDEILNMPAGIEIEALIFEYVFGAKWYIRGGRSFLILPEDIDFVDAEGRNAKDLYVLGRAEAGKFPYVGGGRYSREIETAWLVVEKMMEYEDKTRTIGKDQIIITRTDSCDAWYVEFARPNWEYAEAESLPLAICRAALLATMELE